MAGQNNRNNDEGKGLRHIRAFVTADALLAAVLLFWAQQRTAPSLQLWVKYYQPEFGNIGKWFDPFNETVGFGLLWAYFAVLLALLALAWVGWKTLATSQSKTPDFAVGLFAASLAMGIINVSASVFSVIVKYLQGGQIYSPLHFEHSPWLLLFVLILALFIVGLSIWGARTLEKKGWCKYLPWQIEAIFIAIAAELVLWFIRSDFKHLYYVILIMVLFGIVAFGLIIWSFVKVKKYLPHKE
jgi:hypothetical protein